MHERRGEMMGMPWYNNPALTSKVLNRIANRHPRTSIQDLNTTLDRATQLIWSKQEEYCMRNSSYSGNGQGGE
jgi:hypothetical protein